MGHKEVILKLEKYRTKVDAGEELTPDERAELEAIREYIIERVAAFIAVVREALSPDIEAFAALIVEIWHSLPAEYRESAERERFRDIYGWEPSSFTMSEVTGLYGEKQRLQAIYIEQQVSAARGVQHSLKNNGW